MKNECKQSRVMKTFILTDRHLRRLFESKTSVMGLHRSQHRILAFLARFEDKAPAQKEIAKHFDVSPAAIAVTLRKLEDAGYITRTSPENDNRINTVSITDKARAVIEKTEEFSKELDTAAFADFTDKELNDFERLLEKMETAMKRYEEHQTAKAKGDSEQ